MDTAPEVLSAGYDPAKLVIGSGPFIMDSAVPDVAYTYKRNSNWFEKGLPYIDGYKLSVIPDASRQQAQFAAGNLDELIVRRLSTRCHETKKSKGDDFQGERQQRQSHVLPTRRSGLTVHGYSGTPSILYGHRPRCLRQGNFQRRVGASGLCAFLHGEMGSKSAICRRTSNSTSSSTPPKRRNCSMPRASRTFN